MSIPNELRIKSDIKDYSVRFVDDFSEALIRDSLEAPFFIVDQNVFNLYNEKFQRILRQKKYLIVEATELHKTLDYVKVVIKFLLDNNIKRNNKLIAVGGGIIQDITGFVSSILLRGVEWIFYPTTLLAQSDSCIGSKTSINVDDFKNQLGTFYPPQHIILDVNFLKTLTLTDIKSGLGEIIKVHLLDGEKSLEYINSHYEQAFSDPAVVKELIFRSLMIKKNIIEKDEFDKDYRNIMNYGHTFGHAIESVSNYEVCHGQAVTMGMDIANYISLKMGMLSDEPHEIMREVLLKNYPDYSLRREQLTSFLTALTKDKKNVDENLSAILTEGPGKMRKMKIPLDENLRELIDNYICTRNIKKG